MNAMSTEAIGTEVGQLRERYVRSLDSVEDASERTIAVLQGTRAARETARQLVDSGRPLGDLERVIEPQGLRASLAEALADLERTRHDAQRLLFRLLQSEGQTLADIGRLFGISRQLVSRLVNEPDPDLRG
jgi:DNA-directed RNA polymerase sigma subunit (sigma70/sigma32)